MPNLIKQVRLWSDIGATSDSDGAPCVEPKLSSTKVRQTLSNFCRIKRFCRPRLKLPYLIHQLGSAHEWISAANATVSSCISHLMRVLLYMLADLLSEYVITLCWAFYSFRASPPLSSSFSDSILSRLDCSQTPIFSWRSSGSRTCTGGAGVGVYSSGCREARGRWPPPKLSPAP